MNNSALLLNLLLGALLGATGQVARAIIGFKKTSDEAKAKGTRFSDEFNGAELLQSLLIGAAAGIVGTIVLWDKMSNIQRDTVVSLLGVGYAGADFIEGFFRNASDAALKLMPGAGSAGGAIPKPTQQNVNAKVEALPTIAQHV